MFKWKRHENWEAIRLTLFRRVSAGTLSFLATLVTFLGPSTSRASTVFKCWRSIRFGICYLSLAVCYRHIFKKAFTKAFSQCGISSSSIGSPRGWAGGSELSVALRGTLESSGIVKLDVAIEYVVMASRVRVSKIATFTFNTITSFYFASNRV